VGFLYYLFLSSKSSYVVTVLFLTSRADKTTCSLFAVAAVTFSISLSSNTRGAVNSSVVPFADIVLVLNKLKS
jgi:hypothetical protein